jgi:hypothetical protein
MFVSYVSHRTAGHSGGRHPPVPRRRPEIALVAPRRRGHREIVREMNEHVGSQTIRGLTEFAIPVQQKHFQQAREWSLRLAREEVEAG